MKLYKMNAPALEFDYTHTSKGNQLKWQQDGYWYKADQFGYEGISEYIVSSFLKKMDVPFPFVVYEPVEISYEGKNYSGCRSRDFYVEQSELRGYEIVPLERLHRQYTGQGLANHLGDMRDVENRILYTVDFVRDVTGLVDFADYLSYLIQIDTFFLNEDRHTNNIAVLRDKEADEFKYCPYYDFGLSLFSDTRECFPFPMDFSDCRKKIKAKPFAIDFDEQLDVVEKISNKSFYIPMRVFEIRKEMERLFANINVDDAIKHRVTETVVYQAMKYTYMVKK